MGKSVFRILLCDRAMTKMLNTAADLLFLKPTQYVRKINKLLMFVAVLVDRETLAVMDVSGCVHAHAGQNEPFRNPLPCFTSLIRTYVGVDVTSI